MRQAKLENLERVLCLGAHSDDIEIGCGGTLLQLTAERPDLEVLWVVFSAEGPRRQEAEKSARAYLRKAPRSRVEICDFRGSFFPYSGEAIKEFFETLKLFRPDVVFTHYRDDRHQDHRVVSDLTWNTFRSHLILEYEIPKYDGDFGAPNHFVPVTKRTLQRKIALLERHFPSQTEKHWFTSELFSGVARIRGMECNSATGYAEAFYTRKMVGL